MSFDLIICGPKLQLFIDIYRNIAEDVETIFVTLNYELDRPLPKGKSEKLLV